MFEKILSPPLSLECPSPPSHILHLSPSSHHLPTFLSSFRYLTLLEFHLSSILLFTISFTHPFLTLPHSSTVISLFFHTSDMSNSFSCVFSLLSTFHPGLTPGSDSLFTERVTLSGGLSQTTPSHLLVETLSSRAPSLFQ